jgi:Rrf2 family protein
VRVDSDGNLQEYRKNALAKAHEDDNLDIEILLSNFGALAMVPLIAEYALRTVICLAKRAGRPTSARDLAVATGVPASYQVKVLQSLRRARLVSAVRGLRGGFVLVGAPESLSVQEVIRAVDPRGGLERRWRGTDPLPLLRTRLRDGVGRMEALFASITIADLCEGEVAAPGPSGGDGS